MKTIEKKNTEKNNQSISLVENTPERERDRDRETHREKEKQRECVCVCVCVCVCLRESVSGVKEITPDLVGGRRVHVGLSGCKGGEDQRSE